MRAFLLMLTALTTSQQVFSQISGIINNYAEVTQIDYVVEKVTVDDASAFGIGDRALLIQMTGANIDETNTSSFGDITAANEAGVFEVVEICNIIGLDIAFDKEISRTYDPLNGAVQLVRMPVYNNVSVNGTLSAQAWNGQVGGVLALQVEGTLTLNADIISTGLGFTGGTSNANISSVCDESDYFLPSTSALGAGKGNGIAATIAGKESGRGKQANGGGGGNSQTAGGAGGSNSGAGGMGGNATDAGTCNGDAVGGVAGLGLAYNNSINRVFMGGGGGAGHSNSLEATDGATGGAIIFIIANEIDGNNNSIITNGNDAANAVGVSADGAGGGGGGGAILLDCKIFPSILTLEANGGNGGDNSNTTDCTGPGGGGGGGTVWSAGVLPGSVIVNNNGGLAGTKNGGPGGCSATNYGATDGAPGIVLSGLTVPYGDQPNAGTNGTLDVCVSSTSLDLNPGLGGTPDAGGVWNDDDATGALVGNIFNPSLTAAGTYNFSYTVTSGNCADSTAVVAVTVYDQPDAGTDGTATVCETSTSLTLLAQLGGAPDPGGVWSDDDASGGLNNGILNASVVNPGIYNFSYVLAANGPCVADTSVVTVTITAAPDPGTGQNATVCVTEISVDVSGLLSGTPDAGGSWTDDDASGALSGTIFNPSAAGVGTWHFTYTVNGVAPCSNESTTVTIQVTANGNAGNDNSITVCDIETAVDLFANLGGTPDIGGTWNDDDATGALNNGFVDASATGIGTFDFSYIVAPIGGCIPDTATITMTVNDGANAGNGATMNICTSNGNVDLFTSLLGTPDAGGSWSDDDGSGALTGSILDPAAAGPGVWNFTYTVIGLAPCTNDQATITVNITPGPWAGTDGTANICGDETNFDLFAELGGSPMTTGGWLDDDATGALTGGFFDASQVASGTYSFTYLVVGIGGCANDSANVSVTVTAAPDAGLSGTANACDAITNLDLFTGLGGTPDLTGTWFDTQSTGALTGSNFNATIAGPGTWLFTYVVTGTAPCVNDTSTVAVIVVPAPNAGNNGTLTSCETETNVNLFTGLGGTPDAGGTWNDDDATGALTGGFFDASAVAPGNYDFSYIVAAAGCTSDTATVTVTVIDAPDAGTGMTLYACQAATLDLTVGLGGMPDAGGTWNDDDATGALTGSIFDPAAVALGTYNFTYTVTGTAPCLDASATVTVVVTNAPNAGTDGSVDACDTETSVDLFAQLGGSPDNFGIFIDTDATGALNGATVDASVAGGGSWNFEYIVSVLGCSSDTSIVTVNVVTSPDAGIPTAAITCPSETSYSLFNALAGTPDLTGAWLDDDATGALTGSNFNASLVAQGSYQFTYVVTGTVPCANDSSTVTVIVGPDSDAGNDSTVTVCGSESALVLIDQLGGTPDTTGAWTDDDATGALVAGVFDATQVTPGSYQFTYRVTACGSDSAVLTVNVTIAPDAGSNAAVPVCSNEIAFDLFGALGGTPDLGGSWSDDDNTGALTGGLFDASAVAPGLYGFTYTITGSPPCSDATATVTVIVISGPNPGLDNSLTVCSSDTAVDLFAALGGIPDAGGIWLDDDASGGLNVDMLDATIPTPGIYDFTYVITGCNSDSATVTVTIINSPNAGLDSTVNICVTNTSFDLLTGLGGNPDNNGVWNDNNATGALNGSDLNAAVAGQGTYTFTYLIVGGGVCPNSTATVTANVVDIPDAGVGDTIIACETETSVNLMTGITGASHIFGYFTDDDNTGSVTGNTMDATIAGTGTWHFTYVADAIGCVPDSAQMVVLVLGEPNAGQGDTTTFCSTAGWVNLPGLLSGTPDNTGTWTDNTNAGTLSGDSVDIATLSGVYLFTYDVPAIGACPATSSQLFVEVIANPQAGVGDTLEACDEVVNLFVGLSGTYLQTGTWSDNDGTGALVGPIFESSNVANGIYHFGYFISGQGVCTDDQSEVIVNVACAEGAPPVPEGFSPNDDGVNDFLIIDNIEDYATSKLTVFNRWGNLVYEAEPYLNDWDGTWDRGKEQGEPLPVGTYFYVLDVGDAADPVKGWIYINR